MKERGQELLRKAFRMRLSTAVLIVVVRSTFLGLAACTVEASAELDPPVDSAAEGQAHIEAHGQPATASALPVASTPAQDAPPLPPPASPSLPPAVYGHAPRLASAHLPGKVPGPFIRGPSPTRSAWIPTSRLVAAS